MIQQFGIHKVTNANVADPIVREMLRGEVVDILYSDPPWGEGNAKYWATIAKRHMGQDVRQIPCREILTNIFGLVKRHVRGHVFIEYGCKWQEELMGLFVSNVRCFHRQYYAGSRLLPCITVYGSTSPEFNFTARFNDSDNGADEVKTCWLKWRFLMV